MGGGQGFIEEEVREGVFDEGDEVLLENKYKIYIKYDYSGQYPVG